MPSAAMVPPLDPDLDAFVRAEVSAGRYLSAAEVVRAGLAALKARADAVKALRLALDEGEASGIAEEFDWDEFLAAKRAKHQKAA